jgi:hypothetical protein
MSFLGLTRIESARRNASEAIVKECALHMPDGWKIPIAYREQWIALLRVTCDVPDNLPNLAPCAIELIRRGTDGGTAETYTSFSMELIAMRKYLEKAGPEGLSRLYAKKQDLVKNLDEDLKKSEECLFGEIHRIQGGGQDHSCGGWLKLLQSRLNTQTSEGFQEFLKTAKCHFETFMQALAADKKLEGLWRDEFPSLSEEYKCLESGTISKGLSESLYSTFTDACNKASFQIFKACQGNLENASQE